ncbi:hypothetical protein B0H13DRAFT_1923033 [Mycena leptocephala]|nr:hypothetical protein B0H13DRAFT_1923033 [Mycena leptocephala]
MAFTSIVSRRNRVAATTGITSANIANDSDGEGDVVEKAYKNFQKKLSDEREAEKVSNAQTACEPDASVTRGEIVDFTELDRVNGGDDTARNVVDIIGNDAGGYWDIADLILGQNVLPPTLSVSGLPKASETNRSKRLIGKREVPVHEHPKQIKPTRKVILGAFGPNKGNRKLGRTRPETHEANKANGELIDGGISRAKAFEPNKGNRKLGRTGPETPEANKANGKLIDGSDFPGKGI